MCVVLKKKKNDQIQTLRALPSDNFSPRTNNYKVAQRSKREDSMGD